MLFINECLEVGGGSIVCGKQTTCLPVKCCVDNVYVRCDGGFVFVCVPFASMLAISYPMMPM